MNRIDLMMGRIPREEKVMLYPYNDATGKRVTCRTMNPPGNLTIAGGANLEFGLYPAEAEFIDRYRVTLMDTALRHYDWYAPLPEGVGSVFLDIAYQNGAHGELMHFPAVIAYASAKKYGAAADSLLASPIAQKFLSRYRPLSEILAKGE